jgi:hypothetical protein
VPEAEAPRQRGVVIGTADPKAPPANPIPITGEVPLYTEKGWTTFDEGRKAAGYPDGGGSRPGAFLTSEPPPIPDGYKPDPGRGQAEIDAENKAWEEQRAAETKNTSKSTFRTAVDSAANFAARRLIPGVVVAEAAYNIGGSTYDWARYKLGYISESTYMQRWNPDIQLIK